MLEINFIITKKENLKTLICQWQDEHPISKLCTNTDKADRSKPMSRTESDLPWDLESYSHRLDEKGLPHRRMNGRVYFIKEEGTPLTPGKNASMNKTPDLRKQFLKPIDKTMDLPYIRVGTTYHNQEVPGSSPGGGTQSERVAIKFAALFLCAKLQ